MASGQKTTPRRIRIQDYFLDTFKTKKERINKIKTK